ncbi:hypothetical protein B0H10DRAFT_2040054 [Mycena sp. CBHHK59/15]|nr:hypothetical protein B0H10DRAFT_2040054 [Mycena sp. CBHHK59/15]
MPPVLRSSPASTRTTRNSTKSPTPAPAKASTPSKPRYCTSCKRPRKGHPREGCPFAEDATQDEALSDSPTRSVADALDALNLAAVDGEKEDEGRATRPRKPFTRMPGTLLTPTSSFMYSQSSQTSVCKDETPLAADANASFSYSQSSEPYLALSQLSDGAATLRAQTPTSTPPPPPQTRPLARTLTAEERAAFTTSLAHLAKATVYVLPAADVPAISAAAAGHGLCARELALDHADTLLVVGHTQTAVELLLYQVETKMHALVPRPEPRSVLSAAAKAIAVGAVGAVATFSVMAFS